MVEYTDQSSGAIRFYLMRGDFALSQFVVLEHNAFTHNATRINIGILGESHFVRFECGSDILFEICACSEARIDEPDTLITHEFLPNLHSIPVTASFDERTYSFTFNYMNWESGRERLKDLRSNMSDMHALSLKHEFPSHDFIHEEAVTEIYAVLTNEIRIHTVHTYPNEHVMVFTESKLSQPAD